MGQARELGDGTGALCPSCETWWPDVDEAWWAHIVEEHPRTAARLRASATARVGDGRAASVGAEVRTAIARELDNAARLHAEVRARSTAA